MKTPIPPGVFDIIPEDPQEPWRSSYLWNYVEEVLRETARHYGYQEIRTPIFERIELFQRSVGETSDIVSKEMYAFEDKGGRMMALRPEGTASVMRAFIENQMVNQGQIHKLYYIGPMFRYDRPQAGRYRQHHQFGAEAIGSQSPEQDVELMDLVHTIYKRLGLKNLKFYINCLGDAKARETFRIKLQEHLRPKYDTLSPESKARYEKNPLRILDSKDPQDQALVASAPSILDFLNSESRDQFETVKKLLKSLDIPFEVNSGLVRGLDYYNNSVFEIVSGDLGAQNSIGGGGRYDGLMKMLEGPDLPSVGFATGIERILQTMLKQQVPLPKAYRPQLFLIALGEESQLFCFKLLHKMRQEGIDVQMDFGGRKVGKAMQYANQIQTQYVVVIGENELKDQAVELKAMSDGKTVKIPLALLSQHIKIECCGQSLSAIWPEISSSFKEKKEAEALFKQFNQSLEETKGLIENFHRSLEGMKNLLKQ